MTRGTTQRVPLTLAEHAPRVPSKAELRLFRAVELECRTREEAEDLADAIAILLPDPVQGRLGMMELLLNAIEHGNLEIGSARKGQMLREQRFEDELAERLERAEFRDRRVRVRVQLAFPAIEITIADQGKGFAWRAALASEIQADDAPNGRGIALILRTCFPTLTYRDPGNVAVVRLAWPP